MTCMNLENRLEKPVILIQPISVVKKKLYYYPLNAIQELFTVKENIGFFCIIMDTLGGLLRRTFLDANFIKECFLNLAVWEE